MALMSSAQGSSAPGKAISAMLAGGLLLTVNDAVMKWLTGGYPTGQLLFVRGAFSMLFILLMLRFMGGFKSLKIQNKRLHLIRSLLVVFGTFSFVTGLRYLPLADAIAIVFAGPLFITALAPLMIGEAVGWRRWAAVSIGFLGVLIIVRPGTEAMQWAAIFPIGAAISGAFRDLLSRAGSVTESSSALLATGMGAACLGGLMTYPLGGMALIPAWARIALPDLGLMALSGVLMASAQFLMIESYRYGEAAMVAPFKYSSMVYAVVLGFMIWGDLPDIFTWCGTALLIASGIYILYRERQVKAQIPRTGGPGGSGL